MGRPRQGHLKASPKVRNIARLVRILGISQTELAERAQLNLAYVNQLLSGRKDNPTLETLAKIAGGLGLSVAVLVDQRLDDDALRRELSQAALRQVLKRGIGHPKFVRYVDTPDAPLTVDGWERLARILIIADAPRRKSATLKASARQRTDRR